MDLHLRIRAIWNNVQIATDFIQFRPDVGKTSPENKKTEVKINATLLLKPFNLNVSTIIDKN